MIDVKLIVLFVCISTISSRTNYCEICTHHTLCKYTMPGPATFCKRYDKTSLLTKHDINEIVNRVNERRNFVAMGYLKLLPQAANMKKMVWSQELATFAQRWVDQCAQPDKEDQCRNLSKRIKNAIFMKTFPGNTEVGQNIASISGATSGFNVKSFVDIWFMQIINYSGSVSYYNQTRDHRTNYFSQLIWADTSLLGCGRARFYVNHTNIAIDRLVCNFAPRGNIHGKPTYAVGYPATQCPNKMRPDETFKALCRYYTKENVRKFTTLRPRMTSLLRILNLSNSSVKQEIYPIPNNLKQIKSNAIETIDQRNQKTRHVLHNTHGGKVKHIQPMQIPNFWNHPPNASESPERMLYQQEQGHSRVYHSHDIQKSDQANQGNTRFDYGTGTISSYFTKDSRMNFQNPQCTRKLVVYNTPHDGETHANINSKCTRRNQKTECTQTVSSYKVTWNKIREQMNNPINKDSYPQELCPCNTPKPTARCMCDRNCQNVDSQLTTIYPYILRNLDVINKDDRKKSAELIYYDFPNIGVYSGKTINTNNETSEKEWHLSNSDSYEGEKSSNVFSGRQNNEKTSNKNFNNNYKSNRCDSFGSFGFIHRKKRDLSDQITFMPFWQMDEFTHKKPAQLKSVRYTTISNMKNKLTKKLPTTVKILTSTETITIQMKKGGNSVRNSVTEKYLSFDELMRLRKLGISETETGARRQADENLQNSAHTTIEVTANTPFVRKKHCTRKVTCTWTAASPTGPDGSIIPGGGPGIDVGSRTPPGYVDGCTRTSTCTREYMDRNKWPTSTEESSGEITHEDEDYCEKRALNIRRRNSDEHYVENKKTYSDSYTDVSMTTLYPNFIGDATQFSSYQYDFPTTPQIDCVYCKENERIKRDDHYNNNRKHFQCRDQRHMDDQKYVEESSRGDLYYLLLHKIMSKWKNNTSLNNLNNCMCNISVEFRSSFMSIFFMFICYLIFNLFGLL